MSSGHQNGGFSFLTRHIDSTDLPNPYVVPGGALHQELQLLVEAGLGPLQALSSATGVAAEIARRPDVGVIEAGRRADLIIVTGDPTTDITTTRNLEYIVLGGIPFSAAELRSRAARDMGSG